jgi:hypothetical protein
MISCMGGNCISRGRCANYQLRGAEPVERLCGDEEEIDEIVHEIRSCENGMQNRRHGDATAERAGE